MSADYTARAVARSRERNGGSENVHEKGKVEEMISIDRGNVAEERTRIRWSEEEEERV